MILTVVVLEADDVLTVVPVLRLVLWLVVELVAPVVVLALELIVVPVLKLVLRLVVELLAPVVVLEFELIVVVLTPEIVETVLNVVT